MYLLLFILALYFNFEQQLWDFNQEDDIEGAVLDIQYDIKFIERDFFKFI